MIQQNAGKFVLNSLRVQFVLEPCNSVIYLLVPLSPLPHPPHPLLIQLLSLFQYMFRNLLFAEGLSFNGRIVLAKLRKPLVLLVSSDTS